MSFVTLSLFCFFTSGGSEGVGGIARIGKSHEGVGAAVQAPEPILSLLLHYYY